MFFSSEVEMVVGRMMVTTTEVVAGVCLSTVQDHGAMAMEMERDTEQEVEEMAIHMAILGWLLLPLTSFRLFESLHDMPLYPQGAK